MKYLTLLFSAVHAAGYDFSEFYRRIPNNDGKVSAQSWLEMPKSVPPMRNPAMNRMMKVQFINELRDEIIKLSGTGHSDEIRQIKLAARFTPKPKGKMLNPSGAGDSHDEIRDDPFTSKLGYEPWIIDFDSKPKDEIINLSGEKPGEIWGESDGHDEKRDDSYTPKPKGNSAKKCNKNRNQLF